MDPATALANRVLDNQEWARQRLAAHAGSLFIIAVGPFATAMRISAEGRLDPASLAESAGDLTLTLSPLALPGFLADPARWNDVVAARGDPALATTLQELAQTMPWFVEQVFADGLGPILGQRIADAGRRLLGFPEHAAERIGESVTGYARDEAGLVAHTGAFARFADETAALAAGVDALEPRIDALATRIGPAPASH